MPTGERALGVILEQAKRDIIALHNRVVSAGISMTTWKPSLCS
jgi:hypothetical protein